MTQPDLFDRRLGEALGDLADARVPDYKTDVLARTSRMRQRPAWTFPERWLSMTTIARPAVTRRALPSPWLLITLAALLTAILAATFAVGTRFLRSDSAIVPAPPVGPAKNGLVAYDSGGDIWVVEPDGTDPRALVTDPEIGTDPVWSPDGTRLAFWALEAPDAPFEEIDVEAAILERTVSLVVVRADGSDRRVLVEGLKLDFGDAKSFGYPPSWSPDGRYLAYSHLIPRLGASIDSVSSDGGAPTRLVEEGSSPTWSPDGRSIAFRGGARDDAGVYVLDLDSGDARRVSSVAGGRTRFEFVTPQWSPDSQRIAFHAGTEYSYDIWVANADGSGDTAIVTNSGPFADSLDVWPAWSPDGTRIAYYAESVAPSDVIVVEPDGTDPINLKGERMGWQGRWEDQQGSGLNGATAIWAPDGTRIVGFSEAPPGSTLPVRLHLLDASGADEPITSEIDSHFWRASWQRLAP